MTNTSNIFRKVEINKLEPICDHRKLVHMKHSEHFFRHKIKNAYLRSYYNQQIEKFVAWYEKCKHLVEYYMKENRFSFSVSKKSEFIEIRVKYTL